MKSTWHTYAHFYVQPCLGKILQFFRWTFRDERFDHHLVHIFPELVAGQSCETQLTCCSEENPVSMRVCFCLYNVLCTHQVWVLTECCRNCRCRQCSFGTVLICKYIKRYILYRIVHVFVQHICQSSSVLPCVLLENHHILLEGPVIWNVKMVEQVGASELVVELGRDGVLIFVVDYSGQIIATETRPKHPKS